ncbi:MAG: VCBS repeat-containing protein [Candidatus Midichloria sp.]|nr:VCBS repeat-containing protein [Candidatus Midichloria sp.]
MNIAVANHISYTSILIGNGDGTYQSANSYGVGNNTYGIAVGDFNHDGKSDTVY